MRPRAIDSTTVQGPATKGTQWRVHYSLELVDLNCDWLELTDAHGAELLERTPLRRGDVLLADRNYLRPVGLHAAAEAGAYVLLRLRWSHAPMVDRCQRRFHAWQQAKQLRVGQVGVWSVMLPVPAGQAVSGRVVAMRLPAPRAAKAQRRVTKCARRQGKQLDPRTLQAAQLVMIFTTLPATLLDASGVLEPTATAGSSSLPASGSSNCSSSAISRTSAPISRAPGSSPSWWSPSCLRPCIEMPAFFPPGAIGSKPSLQLGRDLRPSLWRWIAVLVPALRQALCSSPGLLALLTATSRGDLRRALDDRPRCRLAQPARLHGLLRHWILG